MNHIRLISYALVFCLLWAPLDLAAAPTAAPTPQDYRGSILIQVQSYGRAWYVYPKTGERYYLRNGSEALQIFKELSLSISHSDLNKLSTTNSKKTSPEVLKRAKGYVVVDSERGGGLWYVNPRDSLRYPVKNSSDAFALMQRFGQGVKDPVLRAIPMNQTQLTSDFTFHTVAFAKYKHGDFTDYSYGDRVLPLASLTKLMTALVLLDTKPKWNEKITLTEDEIHYPTLYAAPGETSEVALKAGDVVSRYGLWVAMLVSSSNQAAIALADHCGLTRSEFVDKMNEKAMALGLKKTLFFEPSGLEANNVGTAKEFAVLADAAFAQPDIYQTTVLYSYNIAATNESLTNSKEREVAIVNRNYSLLKFEPDGAKTGFLVEAQRNVALKKGDSVIVVLHALSMSERNGIIEKLLKKDKP